MKRGLFVGIISLISATSLGQDRDASLAVDSGSRPNILWISLEDTSPDFGCYGDNYAITPLFDNFAENGVRFTRVFTHAPVCAPSRSGIITGMYPTSIATQHMRCKGVPPPEVKCFTEYLRSAGYYCTNNSKTDYQFDPPFTAWDENGSRAHWRGRHAGQPFFAVFNLINTHESQIRAPSAQTKSLLGRLAADERHDAAKALLPPYYPDTPGVRRDWANYYDNITAVQRLVAQILKQLDDDGLAEDTIVWIWGDHGRGLPRAKRWVYDSGLQVPLLIRVPDKWRTYAGGKQADKLQPGSVVDDLVAFVDFAPTVLSLAGVQVPAHMQGRPFLGPTVGQARNYVFASRDRMDERYDVIRAVRDKRFKYIRNFMSHLPYAQPIAYMELMPTMRDWRRLHDEQKLSPPAELFFRSTKPIDELYDTQTDPHEVNNLADQPQYAAKLAEMRKALTDWMLDTVDLGLIPESILDEVQRPGARWLTTEPPIVAATQPDQNGAVRLTLASATEGASIGYHVKEQRDRPWQLYSGGLHIKKGETLVVKACRIGFRDSTAVELTARSPVAGKSVVSNQGADWRPTIIDQEILKRLLALKEYDPDPTKSVERYTRTLGDKHPAMRYWAVVGLRAAHEKRLPSEAIKAALTRLAYGDDSPAVRIAAAHALCKWGQANKGLPVLAAGLDSAQPSLQLNAAHALEDLGEQARPLLPRLKQLAAKSSEYVQRVTANVVEQLETPH